MSDYGYRTQALAVAAESNVQEPRTTPVIGTQEGDVVVAW
jgi:hypothetical protein